MTSGPTVGHRDPLRVAIDVMDRLRSPGGCPWDHEQTHASLVPYAIEEAHELADAVEAGDRENLREELGDVLLQVIFHARIAQEDPDAPFDIDDIAAGLTAKLIRRHPHVFAEREVVDAEGVHALWEQIKATEKHRDSVLDGIPAGLGALARAQKVANRAARTGLTAPIPAVDSSPTSGFGPRLLALVLEAQAAGVDAEGELRRVARDWEGALRADECARASTD